MNKEDIYQHRTIGWKYDLPSPNEKPNTTINTWYIDTPPNHITDTFIELPRSSMKVRGVGIFGGLLMITATTVGLLLAFAVFFKFQIPFSIHMTLYFGIFIILYWIAIAFIRIDLGPPRDEPIRFNRLRRKVYFYQYRYDFLRLFSRSRWGVHPVAYNWEDLTAEAYSIYAPMGYGGLIEKVMISAHKPGSHEVIERFFFTHEIELGKQYWTIAQLFMQQGPDALPEFEYLPCDWNNDAELSPIRRLAPKVQWPAAMDIESRSAPDSEVIPCQVESGPTCKSNSATH